MMEVDIQGEMMQLLPGKALLWPSCNTMIVSDLHWGKTAHFRRHGIAIPANAQQADEIRLSQMVQQHGVQRLIIAGDMFHSVTNKQVEEFSHWRNAHLQLHIDLVVGNHDILPAQQYAVNDITVHRELLDAGPFLISHDEIPDAEKFHIHGHMHPCFTAGGRGRTSIRLQCFCMNGSRMVLPSFGTFTGCHNISATEYKQIFLLAGDEVIQWQ